MATIRKKSRRDIINQAKRLAKGATKSRRALINSIRDRYLQNTEKHPGVRKWMERNEYLRGVMQGDSRPTRNDLVKSYDEQGGKSSGLYQKDSQASDNHIRGLMAKNTTYANKRRFSREEYMHGDMSKSNSNG